MFKCCSSSTVVRKVGRTRVRNDFSVFTRFMKENSQRIHATTPSTTHSLSHIYQLKIHYFIFTKIGFATSYSSKSIIDFIITNSAYTTSYSPKFDSPLHIHQNQIHHFIFTKFGFNIFICLFVCCDTTRNIKPPGTTSARGKSTRAQKFHWVKNF